MSQEHTVIWLRSLVNRYLASNLLDAAKFYAERLYYEQPGDDSLYLLAQCYFRAGKVKQTYLILQHCVSSPMCKYLFALTCDKLDKLEEGEHTLCPKGLKDPEKLTLEAVRETPGGAEGVYLLGRLCRRQHRKDIAVIYYKLSLRMDPYLWCAVTELSDMGVAVNMKELLSSTGATEFVPSEGVFRSVLQSSDDRTGWLAEVRGQEQGHYYSASSVFRDSSRLDSHRAAEQLGDGTGAFPTGRVSMALGMSSMSLHVPFASPGSMPSPLLAQTGSSMLGGDMTGFNSTGMGSTGLRSVPLTGGGSYTGQGSDAGYSEYDRDHLQGAKTALFGMGTPGLTPVSHSHHAMNTASMRSTGAMRTGLMVADDSESSAIKGVDLFGGSAPNSNIVPAAPHGRRVSFGPTARLSFSGALDGGAAAAAQSAHIAQLHASAEDSGLLQMGGGAAGEDDYPYKLPRADPLVASPTSGAHRSSETSNRALPHKLILSPFPVESSPIAQSQQDGGTPGDELAGGPFLPTTTVRKKYGARGQAAAGPAGATLGDNKENGASAGNRREEHTAGIAAMDETFSGADCQERSGKLVSVDTRAVDHLVVTFARAYQMLSTYCCRACINELQSQLPEKHFRSALVSQWVGKAYYEMNEYKSAMLAFREMLRVEPFRLCGLETLSTALWHLKRDKELCALAQQVVEVDKLAPESWCVVGNCFSLQKEPDTAIRFFQRALQLDPAFTYAHTLCGHEQVNNEDLEKAVESFRAAILHSDRHYNAWYGLGSIYFRQEKYELAEYHFRRALGINPASSVLHCYLGMALHAQGNPAKTSEALEVLTRAAERDVDNPQLHFQRASILVAVDCLPEALAALLVVEEHAPKEPPVHALLGQVYHRMGELQLAIKHLNIAMDLDPKESASLKNILEHIDDPPAEED